MNRESMANPLEQQNVPYSTNALHLNRVLHNLNHFTGTHTQKKRIRAAEANPQKNLIAADQAQFKL